jgi:tetratricopeptide (TPR) repeat protein
LAATRTSNQTFPIVITRKHYGPRPLARANDDLYHYWIDKTPERRALADEAVDAAQRLEPDRPEVHLATAYHFFASYADYERAGVQIALAQRSLPNSSEALWIAGRIARRQGRFDDSTKMLEKAASLDPRNPDILTQLSVNYGVLRRYDEVEKISDRLSEIEPDNPSHKTAKGWVAFLRTGDATSLRASEDRLPSSIKDHGHLASNRFWDALYSRDWAAARQILDVSPDEDLFVGDFVKAAIPRRCGEIWLAALQGMGPMTDPQFLVARDELAKRVGQNPDEPELLSELGVIDAFLGRKQDGIQEARRAVGMMPATKDALQAPWILGSLAEVYAWTNETDSAFQQLDTLISTSKTPLNPEIFKNDPDWEPLRKDPRFDKLLARIASQR